MALVTGPSRDLLERQIDDNLEVVRSWKGIQPKGPGVCIPGPSQGTPVQIFAVSTKHALPWSQVRATRMCEETGHISKLVSHKSQDQGSLVTACMAVQVGSGARETGEEEAMPVSCVRVAAASSLRLQVCMSPPLSRSLRLRRALPPVGILPSRSHPALFSTCTSHLWPLVSLERF